MLAVIDGEGSFGVECGNRNDNDTLSQVGLEGVGQLFRAHAAAVGC